jgi:hypothetical protein
LAFVTNKYKLVQFAAMYSPLLENIEDCEGDISYRDGFAIMDVFPTREEYDGESGRIGIVAYNSVNQTCGLNIKFCIQHGKNTLTIPGKVASFRKKHLGQIGSMTQDYISMITKVRTAWDTIITKFGAYDVERDDVKDLCKQFGVGDRAVKYIYKKIDDGKKYNLWTFTMSILDYISAHNYKSGVHQRKRIDRLVDKVFDYELVMKI